MRDQSKGRIAVSRNAGPVRQMFEGTAWECLAYDAHGDSIQLLRGGLPKEIIGFLAQILGMRPVTLGRTIGIRCQHPSSKKLRRSDGDKVYRTIRALIAASQTLASGDARIWLCRPIRSLGGVAPLTLMDTEAGLELVMQTLGRIEHGIVA